MEDLKVGSKIEHLRYGIGIVSETGLTNFNVFFKNGGEMSFSISNEEIEVLSTPEGATGGSTVDLNQVEEMISYVLDKYGALTEVVELGEEWEGGELEIHAANRDLLSKKIPMETFFHKIVMVRDRLRVLEQNINSHPKLTDEDKVHFQQYITRSYGSLTSFNVLFKHKEDYFSSK